MNSICGKSQNNPTLSETSRIQVLNIEKPFSRLRNYFLNIEKPFSRLRNYFLNVEKPFSRLRNYFLNIEEIFQISKIKIIHKNKLK
jgi:uncharacterized protein YhhL (DUF1145 family)